MSCLLCASANQGEFGTEILVHFPGLKNLDTPPVWVFPKLPVFLNCGFSGFTTPKENWQYLQEALRQLKLNPWRDRTFSRFCV
jgi:hypothetical protein